MSEVTSEVRPDVPVPPSKRELLRVEERDDVLAIVLDRPESSVNLIDEAWLQEMTGAIDRAERERPRGLVLLSAKHRNFIAGADVSLIASLTETAEAAAKARAGQELLSRIEDLPFPTVCAINGSCLGGGLETALAFQYRIVANDDRVVLGLPEVRLGILPGFGGTFRLPRSVGITTALPLILTGKNVRPRKALAIGLADRLAAPELLTKVAIDVARGAHLSRRPRPLVTRATDWALGRTAPGKALLERMTRRNVEKQTGGHYPAPFEIVGRVLGGYGAPRASAMHAEAEAFARLAVTSVSKEPG